MSVREKDDPVLFQRIQEQNLLRQYDLLSNCIEIGLKKGIEAFDKYTLWALNYAAVSNIAQFGGRFREEPVYVGDHIPPHFKEVPHLMDQFFSFIHESWTLDGIGDHPTWLAGYALWRLNWIHPFIEGNGRTARAACYYLISLKQNKISPAKGLSRNGFEMIANLTTQRYEQPTEHGMKGILIFRLWLITSKLFSTGNSPKNNSN